MQFEISRVYLVAMPGVHPDGTPWHSIYPLFFRVFLNIIENEIIPIKVAAKKNNEILISIFPDLLEILLP
ncbi:hypothetical protein GCM10011328_41430 [Hafnia psychrotolerans]|uniref:Uncharacterized protein n=1 Tax=Hafnia psychrotolerans TaxID=1477018 RepID=A0ABQ1H8I4_9GAMM|nr:hypothetical protein GCM10011328_41430 [Hafnia psychrotolerans]